MRDRREDIPALLERLLRSRAQALGRPLVQPTAAQLDRLSGHAWPGNVRELAAVAERALVFGPAAFDGVASGGAARARLGAGFSLAQHLEAIERGLLVQAIEQARGERAAVARLLGLERNTLRYKLNKYDLLEQVR
jgi:DNA-binding NtrC family response regulator